MSKKNCKTQIGGDKKVKDYNSEELRALRKCRNDRNNKLLNIGKNAVKKTVNKVGSMIPKVEVKVTKKEKK